MGIPSYQVFLGQETTIDGTGPVTRTNLCTNPSVETATTGWTYSAGTGGVAAGSLQTTGGYAGSGFFRMTISTPPTGANSAILWGTTTSISGGQTYTQSMYVRPSVTITVTPTSQKYKAGATTGTLPGAGVSCPANMWTRISHTVTPASTDDAIRLFGRLAGLPPAGTYDADAMLVEQSTVLGDYFDGSATCCAWTGTANASTSTSSWAEVTSYVRLERGLTVTRGSTYGAGAQPGTASLTLDNTDGRFTVGNASSPLDPYVHLQSPVKLLRDGRPWFIGRIQSMPLSWPTGGDTECYVQVTLADRLARFGRMSLGTFAVEDIVALAPAGYWPMVEAAGSTNTASQMAPWPMSVFAPGDGSIAFGSATGPVGDGRQTPTFTPGTVHAVLTTDLGAFDNRASLNNGGYATSISAAFSTTGGGSVVRLDPGPESRVLDISVGTYNGTSGIRVVLNDSSGPWAPVFPCAVMDGAAHVVTLVFNTGGSTADTQMRLYVDGVSIARVGGFSGIAGLYSLAATVRVGWSPPVNPGSAYTTDAFAGSISHVAVWTRALSAGEALAISDALRGYTLTTQAAILKVLGWRNQATGAAIDAGVTDNIPSTAITHASLASILGTISDSEAGTLYVSPTDVITWKNRRTALSPTLTLTAADIDGGATYNCDMQGIQTVVTATQNGTTAIMRAADVDTIGEISGSVTSISTLPGDGADHASWVANTGPRGPYIGSLKVDLATSTATPLAAAITGDILAGVTLTGMPSQAPPNSTKLEITGTSETVSATAWEVTWTTTPAGLGSARDLLILDDATFGALDSTHRLAY